MGYTCYCMTRRRAPSGPRLFEYSKAMSTSRDSGTTFACARQKRTKGLPRWSCHLQRARSSPGGSRCPPSPFITQAHRARGTFRRCESQWADSGRGRCAGSSASCSGRWNTERGDVGAQQPRKIPGGTCHSCSGREVEGGQGESPITREHARLGGGSHVVDAESPWTIVVSPPAGVRREPPIRRSCLDLSVSGPGTACSSRVCARSVPGGRSREAIAASRPGAARDDAVHCRRRRALLVAGRHRRSEDAPSTKSRREAEPMTASLPGTRSWGPARRSRRAPS